MTFHDLKLRLEDWWRTTRAVRHLRAIDNRLLADTAAWIGHPGMTDAIYYFGLQGRANSAFTPELLSALDIWQVQLEKSEAAPADQEIKELHRQTEEITRAILARSTAPHK